MKPDLTRMRPRVGAVIAVEGSSDRLNYVARCACGWNAVSSAVDAAKAQADLRALVEAHRKVCARASH